MAREAGEALAQSTVETVVHRLPSLRTAGRLVGRELLLALVVVFLTSSGWQLDRDAICATNLGSSPDPCDSQPP